MLKNNWFNRLFHSNKVKANQEEARKQTALFVLHTEVIKEIKAATTLNQLLDLHKKAWNLGYQNDNLSPCEYGIFRTESIETMKPEEVFLGGIYGLYTKSIPFWEERKEDAYGCNGYGINPEIKLYDMILEQYRRHLVSNVHAIAQIAKNITNEYAVNGYKVYYPER